MKNTKKYKHKPTGKLYYKTDIGTYLLTEAPHGFQIPKNIVESGNDWELVVEKDYEILSFKHKDNPNNDFSGVLMWYRTDGGMFTCLNHAQNFEENLLNNIDYCIHSVKRLSDGEIFTVGDKLYCESGSCIIEDIELVGVDPSKFILFSTLYKHDSWNLSSKLSMSLAKKAIERPVLFTTEDGVDIYNGDTFYSFRVPCEYRNEFGPINSHIAKEGTGYSKSIKEWKDFSTIEKAKEYIFNNSPLLTLKDLEQIVNAHYVKEPSWYKLAIKIAKDKLK